LTPAAAMATTSTLRQGAVAPKDGPLSTVIQLLEETAARHAECPALKSKDAGSWTGYGETFMKAVSKHRNWERATDPPRV
jgi:hypothetical protein